MKIFGVDAGGTSGWCLFHISDGQVVDWEHGQEPDFEVVDVMLTREIDVIVMEDFRLRATASKAMIGNDFVSAQVNGAIRYMCRGQDDVEIVVQQPAQKEFFTNAKLKEAGYYVKGQQHANDAIRHSLLYAVFNAKILNIKTLLPRLNQGNR